MTIKAARNIILIKPVQLKDVIKGTVIEAVITKQKDQPELGEVVAVGELRKPDKDTFPIEGLKPGAIVAYRRYGESKFFLKGEEFMFVSFDDLLGVLELEGNEPKNG